MSFTSFAYFFLLAGITIAYWAVRNKTTQNILLLIASYAFYGWLTPWYCLLLAGSTIVTWICVHWLWNRKEERELIAVVVCVLWNIGMLIVLKYWNYWIPEIGEALSSVGLGVERKTLDVILPIGLSFYTLQAVGMTIDAYRGDLPKQSPLDVALFLAFFPKLIAGPFEKAPAFFTQLSSQRTFGADKITGGLSLILLGLVKKLVVAENIATYVNQIFVLREPSPLLLIVGGIGFMIQIFADFSSYTDLARGSAKMLGIELMENFNAPYLAVSPSDFWGRWHISLSRWFRDYVYIPLGGSRSHATMEVCWAFIITMALSGMWHGASSNFLVWGLYYGLLMSAYHILGMGGHWHPTSRMGACIATAFMLLWTLIGWIIFRSNDLGWLLNAVVAPEIGFTPGGTVVASVFLTVYAAYLLPWILASCAWHLSPKHAWPKALLNAVAVVSILIFGATDIQDFIYVTF